MKRLGMAFLFAVLLAGTAFGSGLNGTFVREYQNVRQLTMNSLFVATTLRGQAGSSLKIEAFNIPTQAEVFIEERNGHLTVRVEQKPGIRLPTNSRPRLVISLPFSADLDLSSASGSFQIDNMDGQRLRVRTASGAVSTSNTTVPLDIETVSGAINVRDAREGKLLRSSSGAVTMEEAAGDAVIRTVSGAIRLSRVSGAIKAESTSGAVSLDTCTGRIYLTSVSGRLSGNRLTLQEESSFQTTSGAIDLRLTNPASDFSYEASSTSGSITVFGSSAGRSLRAGDGPKTLSLRSVSGSISIRNF